MIFDFKNLGIIESASIELKGLTVITGLNDTGKSFLSKAIYSIIKTVNESGEQAITEKYEQITNLINLIFSIHRQNIPFTQEKMQIFNPNEVTNKIFSNFSKKVPNNDILIYLDEYKTKVINDLNENIIDRLRPTLSQSIDRIENLYSSIKSILLDELDDEKKYKSFFDKVVIQKLFQSQFNDLSNNSLFEVKVMEGETELLRISVKDNKTQSFKNENLFLINDATIIETPTIVQLAKFITTTLAFPPTLKKLFQQRSELPYTYYDLLEKMNLAGSKSNLEYTNVFDEITKTIGGELQFKIEEGAFVFKKENGNQIKSFNIATGIKSLGLVQLLLNSGTINPRTILIIDEPEVHLHPKWEIQYAKALVLLSKVGIPIIISTHSPYLLQGIAKYVKDFDIEDITKVYFGEKKSNGVNTCFKDVTNRLEPIFTALSKPMQNLYL